jgi:exodeoxyribonuclease VII small subunit
MSTSSANTNNSPAPSSTEKSTGIPSGKGLNLPDDWNYEATVETIEDIIGRIETGEMELADIFDQFAIAVNHLQQCELFLDHHRQQVDVLIETLVD